jgi:hypothetical protein
MVARLLSGIGVILLFSLNSSFLCIGSMKNILPRFPGGLLVGVDNLTGRAYAELGTVLITVPEGENPLTSPFGISKLGHLSASEPPPIEDRLCSLILLLLRFLVIFVSGLSRAAAGTLAGTAEEVEEEVKEEVEEGVEEGVEEEVEEQVKEEVEEEAGEGSKEVANTGLGEGVGVDVTEEGMDLDEEYLDRGGVLLGRWRVEDEDEEEGEEEGAVTGGKGEKLAPIPPATMEAAADAISVVEGGGGAGEGIETGAEEWGKGVAPAVDVVGLSGSWVREKGGAMLYCVALLGVEGERGVAPNVGVPIDLVGGS